MHRTDDPQVAMDRFNAGQAAAIRATPELTRSMLDWARAALAAMPRDGGHGTIAGRMAQINADFVRQFPETEAHPMLAAEALFLAAMEEPTPNPTPSDKDNTP